ncbi:NAD-dependent epimerase/dehydratase family protein [Synechococcus sp. RSCCF101]|uniref:NAD-dependent epimerase/dehydratase family protein n=1 Tax=Synechococcus sp. RSCCF101 TaxID=2511069 RepID=UPI001246B053|nr:NAD-dependent epimerase/dehydratase family protein [Synechococcus sp. RSCCF101]QEY32022.1 NAD-dependent epimerase/dehydratase family protein [Synechococcus sp. RSCCF101]
MSAPRPDAARVAITGASGALGQALCERFLTAGWSVLALTSGPIPATAEGGGIRWCSWRCGEEAALLPQLEDVDLLVINHGLNVHGERSADAVRRSLEINALSGWRLLELVLEGRLDNSDVARSGPTEVWVNTSEAEVLPALSPLYEISKRLIGQLVSLRRPDARRCGVRLRTLVLGPFRSSLNPIGVMTPGFVAARILNQASWPLPWIVVTPNPLTWLLLPLSELVRATYFVLFSRPPAEHPDR